MPPSIRRLHGPVDSVSAVVVVAPWEGGECENRPFHLAFGIAPLLKLVLCILHFAFKNITFSFFILLNCALFLCCSHPYLKSSFFFPLLGWYPKYPF
ncbi:hypothetical protein AOQ84DRAFT_166114 [Glonium stellatum]|uniref:Uncharacterized protein n=1 Tax=Glonium stellatum TaxID=574774 RepID=A0A8E2EQ79_9PEZI|nr:hypothetical protein AOQ84DRAFT_166114 [Glonium stellatum]